MKRWILFLSAYLCLCLAAGCATAPVTDEPAGEKPVTQEPAYVDPAVQPEGMMTETFRIVTAEGGAVPLLLAKADGTGTDVYSLGQLDVEVLLDGLSSATADFVFRPGALLDVTYDGMVLETFPAQFACITGLNLRSDGFDDRCTLYLQVMEDLWYTDEGLNSSGVTCVGLDLSQTSLTESEQAALAWTFGSRHRAEPVQGTWQELVDQGWITAEGTEGGGQFWQWTDGVLFSVTEQDPADGTALTFAAQKWRSSLGAYYFEDCTARKSADGCWAGYSVGSEAIS